MATSITGAGGTVTSFSNTPQAQDDLFTTGLTTSTGTASVALTEDNLQVVYFNVMANDLGGAAKTLFSIDNGLNSTDAASSTDLLTQDTARAESTLGDTSLKGAHIWITADGKVGYDATDPALSTLINETPAGQFFTDSFTYAIRLGNGTLSWATATVKIAGVNDAPTVTSDATASVAENAPASTVVYTATATDPDAGDTKTWSLTGTDASLLTINASTGAVTLNASANFEAKNSYSFNVVDTDSGGLTGSKAVVLSVT